MSGMSVKRSLAWMGGTSLFGQVITWSITIVVARLLTPEDYGLVAIAGIYTVLAHAICLMGVSTAVVQAESVTEYQIRALYGFSILMGILMFGVGLLAAPVMAWGFDDPRLTWLVAYQNLVFIVGAPKSLQWSLLARDTRFDVIAKIETASRVLTSLCVLAMAAAGLGVWALASQWILIELFQFIAFSCFRRVRPTFIIRWTEVRDLLLFGIRVLMRNSVGQIYSQIDIFIFGKLASSTFLGGYSFAKQLTNMPFEKIITIINRVLLPYLCKDKDDHNKMRDWTMNIAYLQVLFLVPFYYVLFFCAAETVYIVLGDKWAVAVFPLQIFCVANIFKLGENYAMVALTALGRIKEQVRFVFIQLVLMGSGFLGTALWIGPESSLYVWITVYPLLSIVFCTVLLKTIDLKLSMLLVRIKGTLVAHAALVLSLMVVQHFVKGAMWETLSSKLAGAATVYILALFIFDREKFVDTLRIVPVFSSRKA